MRVAYFAPDATQGSVAKRIVCFQDMGAEVTSFTFRRDRESRFETKWRNVDLGVVPNEQYLRRMLHMPKVMQRLWAAREHLRAADVFYARMLDSALVAMIARRMFNPSAPLYYEVCDIRRVMMSPGKTGRTARMLERRVLGSARRVVVNSPAFVTEYMAPLQGYSGDSFLLENKIYATDLVPFVERRSAVIAKGETEGRTRPFTIAWFGNLDDPVTWHAIRTTAARFPDKVRFYLRGYLILPEAEVRAGLAAHPNIEYGGPFNNMTDLPDMYGRVDAVLGLDLMNQEGNSWWLLPNSLYEAGSFCRPLITSVGTVTATRVEERNTGWVLAEPVAETLPALVESLAPDSYRAVELNLARTDPSIYAGQDQFEEMVGVFGDDIAATRRAA